MRASIALFISPFVLAVACGARVEQAVDVDAGGTASASSGTTSAAASEEPDSGPPDTLGTDPVHCAPVAAPLTTATCTPGSACDIEGGAIVCKPHTGPVNCGRVHCEGRCSCGGLSYGSFCTCK